MKLSEKESFLDYKKRVIDSKSASFCGAKWYNATIWLGSGMTTSCHHPPAHMADPAAVLLNPKALHNTEHKKEMRRQMQAGIKPSECQYCWKMENLGPANVSDRVFKTRIYSEEELARAFHADPAEDVNLKTLEVAFDRICNFACSYCNANFSSKWAADILKNGPYTLGSDGSEHFTAVAADAGSSYVEAFWKWWPELSQTLNEIRVTGGEPLLSEHTWRLFDYFADHPESTMALAINSNLGLEGDRIESLIQKTAPIKNFKLYTSCEARGAQAEYIRDGLNYERWRANLVKILDRARIQSISIMMTVNALGLYSLVDFLNEVMELKSLYPQGKLGFSVNILRFPSFQSVLTLPLELRQRKSAEIKAWLKANENFVGGLLSRMEAESLLRLAEYLLADEDSPHDLASGINLRRADFKKFYTEYDRRRNKNFEVAFSGELAEWYTSL